MIRLKEWKIKPTVWDIYKMTDFISGWNSLPDIKIEVPQDFEPGCLPVDTKDPVELSFQKQRDEFSYRKEHIQAAKRISDGTTKTPISSDFLFGPFCDPQQIKTDW